MTEEELEIILRHVKGMRPAKDCGKEERMRLLLKRNALLRQIDSSRITGSAEELLKEVNVLYRHGARTDRIKEKARVLRIGLLWHAIEKRGRLARQLAAPRAE